MYYIGLMSGTSVDGIDAALIHIDENDQLTLKATYRYPYPTAIRDQIQGFCQLQLHDLAHAAQLDIVLGELFADAVNALLMQHDIDRQQIRAIGSHGQTLRHEPHGAHPYSLQAGNPSIIARHTGITTVANFRAADIAAGGQGAPLAPAFHNYLFRSTRDNRVILNLGGIANITYLPADSSAAVLGFDTGPANTLLDQWITQQRQQPYDKDGAWAAQGQLNEELLNALLQEPYFAKTPPKSTGRELFHLPWLQQSLATVKPKPADEDVQHTLVALSAETVARALKDFLPPVQQVYVCGGGAHNPVLLDALQQRLGETTQLASTEALELDPDWVEAAAFAWLAQQALAGKPGNLPSVTGAKHAVILGAIYPA